jgi:hypothetical protein
MHLAKHPLQNQSGKVKKKHAKRCQCIPKGYPNGAKFDAQSHQKPKPKLLAEKIMKIINNHVFLMCKTCKFIIKTMFFESLAGCVRERQMIKKTSKMKAKSIPKSMKNHVQNGPEKVMQNDAPNGGNGGGG